MNTSTIIKAKEIALRVHEDKLDKKCYPYKFHLYTVEVTSSSLVSPTIFLNTDKKNKEFASCFSRCHIDELFKSN